MSIKNKDMYLYGQIGFAESLIIFFNYLHPKLNQTKIVNHKEMDKGLKRTISVSTRYDNQTNLY